MVSRPDPQPTALFSMGCAFKLIAIALIAVNVIWHGLVALFIGGPVGLGVFLLAVASIWVGGWVMMRRVRDASAEERPDPVPSAEAEGSDHAPVGTGVG